MSTKNENEVTEHIKSGRCEALQLDNIFIDVTKVGKYSICPIINGLSDHDAQSITLHSISSRPPTKKYILSRKINEYTINDFLLKLS